MKNIRIASFAKNLSPKLDQAGRKTIYGQFGRYSGALLWLIRTFISLSFKRFVFVVLTSVGGVGTIGIALGLLFKYAQMIEANATITVPYLNIDADPEKVLLPVSGLALVFLTIGSILIYASRHIALLMKVNFLSTMNERIILIYGGKPDKPNVWQNNKRLQAGFTSMTKTAVKKNVMALRRLTGIIVPIAIFFSGLFSLFYLNFLATLVVVTVIATTMWFFYLINLSAVQATKRLEVSGPKAGRATKQLIAKISGIQQRRISPDLLRKTAFQPLIDDYLADYRGRFVAVARSEFVSYLTMAFIIAGLVVYLSRSAMADDIQWTVVIAYLIALRLTMNSLRNILQTMTMLSRFYPSIRRLQIFLGYTSENSTDKPIEQLKLNLDKDAIVEAGNKKSRNIEKGTLLAISAPILPNRYSGNFFAQSFIRGTSSKSQKEQLNFLASSEFIGRITPPPFSISIAKLLDLPMNYNDEWLRKSLANLVSDQASISLHQDYTPEEWDQFSPDFLKKLARLKLMSSERPILIAEAGIINNEWLEQNLEWLQQRILILVYPGIPKRKLSINHENFAVVAMDSTIVAFGSQAWISQNRKKIQEALAAKVASLSKDDVGDEQDDEDENN